LAADLRSLHWQSLRYSFSSRQFTLRDEAEAAAVSTVAVFTAEAVSAEGVSGVGLRDGPATVGMGMVGTVTGGTVMVGMATVGVVTDMVTGMSSSAFTDCPISAGDIPIGIRRRITRILLPTDTGTGPALPIPTDRSMFTKATRRLPTTASRPGLAI
jgi:hypothetical protein